MRFGAVCPFDYLLTTDGFPCASVLTERMNFFEWIELLHFTNQTERQNNSEYLSAHTPTQRPKNRMFTVHLWQARSNRIVLTELFLIFYFVSFHSNNRNINEKPNK